MITAGCTVKQNSEHKTDDLTENDTLIENEASYYNTGDLLEANVKNNTGDDYSENIDILLYDKFTECSELNDDVVGALYFIRKGENEPFECCVPVIYGDDTEYYATHNYDGRTVKGGAIQILNDEFKEESWTQVLIFGYRLGINSYLESEFNSKHNDIYLLTNDNITKFKVFGIEEIALEQDMIYTKGVIPKEAYGVAEAINAYSNDEKQEYYSRKSNIEQITDADNRKILIICSDGRDNDSGKMSVLYAYEIPMNL